MWTPVTALLWEQWRRTWPAFATALVMVVLFPLPFTWLVNVSERYFETLRMPLVAGRALTRRDDARAAPVAVVNETLARRLAPTGGPAGALGRTFRRDTALVTVVGVVRDAQGGRGPHLGLGLYVARLIAEFHGGSIDARNLADGDGVVVRARFARR